MDYHGFAFRLFVGRGAVVIALSGLNLWAMTMAMASDRSRSGAPDAQSTAAQPMDAKTFASRTNEAFGVIESRIVDLKVDTEPGKLVTVDVPIEGQQVTLSLWPHSVRGSNYQVFVQVADGSLISVPPTPIRTIRGEVVGRAGTRIAGSILEQGLSALIQMPDGRRYGIEPLMGRVDGAVAGQHAVYNAADLVPTGGTCGVKLADKIVAAPAGGIAGGLECIEMACDADVEYYQDHGSNVTTVQNQIDTVTNIMNNQYEDELSLQFVISTILVRTAEPDPYTSTNPDTLLTQFRSEWNANQSSIPRDVAQLFTGKEIDGTVIGIAWNIGVVCAEINAYCLVQSDFSGSLACKTDLSAHELGHCMGAFHCDCPGTTMFPSIQCANTFAAQNITEISNYANSAGCITSCETGTATLPLLDIFPSTTIDSAKWTGVEGATINTTGTAEPSAPNSLNLDGNAANGGDVIRSALINTSNLPVLVLEYSYERRGGGDSPEAGDDLVVEYIANNGLWTELHRQLGSGADMTTYELVSADLPANAKHPNFRLRFRAISNTAGSDDWFIDNVNLFGEGFPSNDICTNAMIVSAGLSPFTTLGAQTDGTDEPGTCNFGGFTQISNDVWYIYTAQCTGIATIGLCGSDYNAKMAIYNANCPSGSGQTIACADNVCGDDPQNSMAVTSGQTYRIRVGGYNNAFGSGTMSITCKCMGDISPANGNGIVDVDDLLAVINTWGPCANPNNCSADIAPPGGNDVVDVDDLLTIINHWGPCL